MTFREKMADLMISNGLWPKEAAEVLTAAEADKALESMRDRWGDDVEDYPLQMLTVLWMSVRHIAAEWLALNKPQHFARPLFEDYHNVN